MLVISMSIPEYSVDVMFPVVEIREERRKRAGEKGW
jgi:hypothetical protein